MKALTGVRVLDLTHMLSGPYATMTLADLGAETIKVEPPGGERTRRLLPGDAAHTAGGMSGYFLALNRNKRSVAIDLKTPRGRAVFHELAAASDVVMWNFGAGVADRLAIARRHLAPANPGIVTCSITGFGETGPLRGGAAFDMVAQATGGGMSMTGRDGEPPTRAGLPIGDLGAGMAAVIGVLAALRARDRTGHGQHVDISMHDVQVSLLSYAATLHAMSGWVPGRLGNAHPLHVPYDTYQAADGWLVIAVVFDAAWPALLGALRREPGGGAGGAGGGDGPGGDGADAVDDGNDLIRALDTPANRTQPGRLANRAAIDRALAGRLRTRPRAYWLDRLRAARVPCAPVYDLGEALREPHVAARDMLVDVPVPGGGAVKAPGNPIKLSADTAAGSGGGTIAAPPRPGEHTDAVLRDLLGKTDAELAALRAAGAIA